MISQTNLGNQEMIQATQFSTMVGDPWIWAYPSTVHMLPWAQYIQKLFLDWLGICWYFSKQITYLWRKLCPNPLAWTALLISSGHQAMSSPVTFHAWFSCVLYFFENLNIFHVIHIRKSSTCVQHFNQSQPQTLPVGPLLNFVIIGLDNTLLHSCRSHHLHGLVQDCSNSIANALELLLSCTKPSNSKPLLTTDRIAGIASPWKFHMGLKKYCKCTLRNAPDINQSNVYWNIYWKT